jgi:phosphate transport system substrate-binding protein
MFTYRLVPLASPLYFYFLTKQGGTVMKRKSVFILVFAIILSSWLSPLPSVILAQEKLRSSCSAQVFEAFGKERLQSFTQAKGIEVDVYVSSSSVAVDRLFSGQSDIASIARGGKYPLQEGGYIETIFCKDPLAIIVNAKSRVSNISEEQLKNIFNRTITNWKQLGGADETIMLVVPGKSTAAHDNFGHMVMKRTEIQYDIMTNLSTTALEVVKRFPAAISFVTQGAVAKAGGIKMVRVNGLAPKDKGYPYFQEFSFITKGKPEGAAKAFIDFTLSDKGKEIIGRRGMIPVGP